MKSNIKQFAVFAFILAAIFSFNIAFAGSGNGNTTFSLPESMITAWLTGSMGRLFAIGALAIGLGVGIVKQSIMSVAVGVGIALAASMGPSVLQTILGSVL